MLKDRKLTLNVRKEVKQTGQWKQKTKNKQLTKNNLFLS